MSINENYILKKLGTEYMIIPLVDGGVSFNKLFNVTETGALIFNGLKDGKRNLEIVEELMKIYDIDEQTCLNDVNEFIEELRTRGIYND